MIIFIVKNLFNNSIKLNSFSFQRFQVIKTCQIQDDQCVFRVGVLQKKLPIPSFHSFASVLRIVLPLRFFGCLLKHVILER
jgi:hypothetical protein